MGTFERPLAGCVVNVSISESDDSANRGFPAWQVNRVTLQVVAALFGQGASIVFGHDWREDGVMEAVYGYARQVQPPVPLPPSEVDAIGQPLLINLLPWPDKPYLPPRDIERLSSTLRVQPAGLPKELRRVDKKAQRAGPESPLYRYVRARGLTSLRHRLNDICHLRLCLGGRRSGSAGRYPGVIEEALLALRSNKPLYLAGLLGGATHQIVEAIEGKAMPKDFCPSTPVESLYANPPFQEADTTTKSDRVIDRRAVWAEFADAGRKRISNANRLTDQENIELFYTPALDRVIELVLIGLSRLVPDLSR
jgi:SLOG-like protein